MGQDPPSVASARIAAPHSHFLVIHRSNSNSFSNRYCKGVAHYTEILARQSLTNYKGDSEGRRIFKAPLGNDILSLSWSPPLADISFAYDRDPGKYQSLGRMELSNDQDSVT